MSRRPVAHVDPATPDATKDTAPAATRAGGSVNVDRIADPEVRQLKAREAELKAELADIKGQMRVLSDEKDAVMRKLQPQQDRFFEKIDKERDELLKEKDVVHRRMDELKIQQNTASSLRDQMRLMDFESEPQQREVVDLRRNIEDLQGRLRSNTDLRARLLGSLAYKTISEVDQEIAKLDKQIAQSTKKGEAAVAAALSKQKKSLEKTRTGIEQSYEIDDALIRDREQLGAAQAALAKKDDRRREMDENRKRIREELAALPQFNREFDSLRARLVTIATKLDESRKKSREGKPGDDRVRGAQEQLTQLRLRRDQVNVELDQVVASVPCVVTKFDPALRPDIIGRGGATLAQLQADFGVAIDVDGPGRDGGEMIIVGGKDDCQRAAAAITQMLEGLAASRLKKTISFEPALARGLIGARGSNIDRIQRVSGARVNVDSTAGVITITGSEDALQAATTLVEEFFFENAEAVMKFPPDMFDIVLGKGGATVRKIEEESGCKKLRIDREAHLITMFGSKTAVEKAKEAYTTLLQDMASGSFTMRVDERMVRLIIGRGGQTINEITRSTGALIDIKDTRVTIRGPKDAVANARQQIEDLTRRDEVKIPFEVALLRHLTTPAVVKQVVDGNEVEVDGLCPLEEIRQDSGCDQVSAIRSESKIVIRGKRECVTRARDLLEQLFREIRPDTVELPFHEVLLGTITRRPADGQLNELDAIQRDVPGLLSIGADRSSARISVSGQRGSAATGAERVQALLNSLADRVTVKKVPGFAIGSIIGTSGAKVNELQKKFKCDIFVARDRNEVQVFGSTKEAMEEAVAAINAIVDAETARGPPARR